MSNLHDPRRPEWIEHDHKLADEFATKGSLKHFLLRQGFMPDNEEVAEKILINLIREGEDATSKLERIKEVVTGWSNQQAIIDEVKSILG